ncbi:FecCD family ABC transporter permease [Polyangium jinanense]|uniref:Iron ABC transporter permease n=1 Tax=Polyangium jinanense TaxID=2829994 RepID=A0A9X4ATY2_9BACT|nr:iron ABC transporter permease [Polyangium jinanense]MDC3957255.1 iron ABC transporter permease [Polyangium jinanense]MDC3982657.1 iron ABC transporter permease [Polyangium jinanense]
MIRRPILPAAALLVLVTALALAFGTEPISLSNALAEPGLARTILLDVRMPRVALAAMAGAGLGVVGAAFQALLRNPLAEPYVLGVSGGAALGATTAIALGLGATTLLGAALIPAASLLGGLVATSLVYAVARGMRGGASGTAILLAGVMVNSMAAALITFLKALVPPSRAQQLLRWLVGFVDLPHVSSLLAALVYVGVGCFVLLLDAGRLNVLVLGDETAGTLGVDVRALERRTFIASSCVVGAIVSLTGLIGFVGLVVPHAVRRLIGPDQRRVLPVSLLSGATMLIGCDLVARLSFRSLGTEPPVGAVTALIGGPAFLVLLRRSGG